MGVVGHGQHLALILDTVTTARDRAERLLAIDQSIASD